MMQNLLEIAEDGLVTGDFKKALEALNKLIEEDPSERAYYLKGYLHYCQNDYDSAIPELEYVIREYPGNDEAYYYLSQIYSLKDQYEEAKEYIEKALAIDEENIDYLGDYVFIEQTLKNYEHCIELCDRLLEETPDGNYALNARGFCHLKLGNIGQAITDFRKNTKENPMDFVGWNNLGVACLETGKYKDAKKAFMHALQANPGFSDPYAGLAYLFFKQGDQRKAFLYINKALELDPNSADAYKKRGEFYLAAGDKSAARSDLVIADDLGYHTYFDDQVKEMLAHLDDE